MSITMFKKNSLAKLLGQTFGYTNFKEGQEEVIHSLLNGRDTLLIKSTGGGKSLCYQLPSLLFDGLTIVISPLVSLMEDQVHQARMQGRRDIVALHSGLSRTERNVIVHQLDTYRLIYLSPEGIQNEQILSALKKRGVSLFVVDEAHCISWWGHDFRPDYLKLADVRSRLGQPICLALTATATEEVKQDILEYLNMKEPAIFQYSVDRQNIALLVEHVSSEQEKMDKIIQLVSRRNDPGMIYFSSRAKAEELTNILVAEGIHDVAYYHGGMSSEERQLIQQQFIADELRLICATNAFGMGINKPNIRYVIHYHFPHHLEAFVQEMGRCSRDGRPGLAYVLTQDGDEQIPYHFIEQNILTEKKLQQFIKYMLAKQANHEKGSLEELIQLLGVSEQAIHVILFYLEKLQVIRYDNHSAFTFSIAQPTQLFNYLHQRIELLRQRKLKKVADMMAWLQLKPGHCRRRFLLDYFSETLTDHPNVCCDLCGLNSNVMVQDIVPRKRSREVLLPEPDWRSRLNALWPIE